MIRSISRPDGYAPLVGTWLGALAESRDDLLSLLEDLTREELHRRILPGCHSIAEILWHVANVELWWVREVVLGEQIDPETRARFGLTVAGDLNTPPQDWGLDRFIGLMDEAYALTREVYRTFSDEAFRERPCRIPGREKRFTPEWIAYNLLDHVANHRGQVAMIKRLLRERG
ncbi:MAG: DinB family protein [Bacillota bacterium]